jgi:hypothetical protein
MVFQDYDFLLDVPHWYGGRLKLYKCCSLNNRQNGDVISIFDLNFSNGLNILAHWLASFAIPYPNFATV